MVFLQTDFFFFFVIPFIWFWVVLFSFSLKSVLARLFIIVLDLVVIKKSVCFPVIVLLYGLTYYFNLSI